MLEAGALESAWSGFRSRDSQEEAEIRMLRGNQGYWLGMYVYGDRYIYIYIYTHTHTYIYIYTHLDTSMYLSPPLWLSICLHPSMTVVSSRLQH